MSDYTEAETLHAEIDRLVGCRPGCGWNCRWRSLRVLKPKQSRRLSAGGDHAMTSNSTNSAALQSQAETAIHLLDDWFDPIEVGLRDRVRDRVREFIQAMIEAELEAALSRPRYARRPKEASENASGITGHRRGHVSRALLVSFGRVDSTLRGARLDSADGKTTEWKSTALRAYQRRTQQA